MKNSALVVSVACLCLLLSSCGSDSAPATHDASNVAATVAPNGGLASSGADSVTSSVNSKMPGAGGASASSGFSNGGSSNNRRNPKPSPVSSVGRAGKVSALASIKLMTSVRMTMQVFLNNAVNMNPTNKSFGGIYDVTWSGNEVVSVSSSDPKADIGYLFWKGKFAHPLRHAERETVQAEKTVLSAGQANMPPTQEWQVGFASCAQDGIFRVHEATIEYDPVLQAATRLDLTIESTDLKVSNNSRAVSYRFVMAPSQVAQS